MKRTEKWIALTLALVLMLTATLTACSGNKPSSTVNLKPIDDGGLATRPTVAVPYGTMRFTDLLVISGETISWANLSKYTHSLTSATSAVFPILDTHGAELELFVDFDADSDAVLRADVVYGDVSTSILNGNVKSLVPLLQAMIDDYNAQDAAE